MDELDNDGESAGPELRPPSDLDDHEAWAMVESSPDGMILTDEHGVMLLVNTKVESLFGFDRCELLGRAVEELLPGRFRQVHTAHRTRYRVRPTSRAMGGDLDLLGCRKDGSEFPVEVSLSPVTNPDGMLRVVATVRDITDRLAGEAHNQAVLWALDAACDGVFMFSPDTLQFSYVNQGAINQLGYSREELLVMSPVHIKPEFTETTFREMLGPLLAGEVDTHVLTTVHRRKDGRDVPVEINLEYPPAGSRAGFASPGVDWPRPPPPGQARMLVAVVRDITDRLLAAEAVRASEAAFRLAFDQTPVGMAISSIGSPENRVITNVNQALCSMLGYTHEELLTKTFTELTHPDDVKGHVDALLEMEAGDRDVYEVEKRCIHAAGHDVWVWLHSVVLPDDDGKPTSLLAHVVDITDKKLAEAQRDRNQHWLAGLAEIRAAALSSRPIDETLNLVCAHAKRLVGAEAAVIGRPDRGGDHLRHIAFDSTATQRALPDRLPMGVSTRAALGGQPFLTGNISVDSEVDERDRRLAGDFVEEYFAVTSVMAVPIRSVDGVDSVLIMSTSTEDSFDEDDVELVSSFAAVAAAALRLSEARRHQAQINVLQDRERLARDLHDIVIQRLFAAGMGLQAVHPLAANPDVSERIADTVTQLDETIVELRSAIFRLSTPGSTTVADQLVAIIDDAEPRLGFRPSLTFEGDPETIPGNIAEHLAPALTEALSNVARHARATTVDVSVTTTAGAVKLLVADDGVGLDPASPRGSGLDNLESRAEQVGGTCKSSGNIDGGTTLTWTATFQPSRFAGPAERP